MASFWGELKRRNVVRVAIAYAVVAWVSIEVSATTFPMLKLPEWAATFVTVLLLIGFPVALIFAWAFEFTPQGLKREHEVDASESITHLTGRKLDFMIITVLVLALGYFAFDKFVLDTSRDAELMQTTTEAVTEQAAEFGNAETAYQSIAVLAFVDLSPAGDQEYFSDGISEEILNVLTQIPDLRVTSRSSAFSFKGKGVDIPTVAKQLGVTKILEGSVRKSGKHIRITAQLIDARTDTHLWSETYDRELDDIFAVQDEIAQAVVSALKLKFLGATSQVNQDVDAYDSLMRLRGALRTSTGDEMLVLIESLETLTRDYPDYADAYATLAEAYGLHGDAAGLIPEDVYAKAIEAGRKSVDLAPESAGGYIALGSAFVGRGRFIEAGPIVARALQLQPGNADVLVMQGELLSIQGQYLKAVELTERALLRDPLNAHTRSALAYRYGSVGRGERGVETLSLGLEIDPDDLQLLWALGEIHYRMGRLGLAAASIGQLIELEPSHINAVQTLFLIQFDAGDLDAARRTLERGETLSRSRLADERAMYCYDIGNTDCWHAATTRMLATRKRFFVQTWQARMLYESGLPHEAIQSLLPVVEYFDQTGDNYGKFETRTNLAALYHLTGDTERCDGVLETVVAFWKFGIERGYEFWDAYFDLASAAAARGDVDEALRNLEEAYARGFRQLWQFHHRIAFDKMRDNPEFQSLVEQIRSENAAQLAVRGHQR